MDEGPTQMNGPLQSSDATTDDREMKATFANMADAEAAQRQLVQSGIAAERVQISSAPSTPDHQASVNPSDGIIGRIRQAIEPDEGSNALRAAARDHDAVLTLRPRKEEVEAAVRILQAAKPTHFDAALERWRNLG